MTTRPTLLITNDDGIEAPGLATLAAAASALANVVVVAPTQHLSGCSHQVTVDRPLTAARVRENWYAVNGTPVDCVRLALLQICPAATWVLSGVNDGGNLGIDVWMSGTVAAVREASFLGRRGIALSQYRRRGEQPVWSRTAAHTARVLEYLLPQSPSPGNFWNVNFPAGDVAMAELIVCRLDPHPLPVKYEAKGDEFHYRTSYQDRHREPKHDVDVCFGGDISITPVDGLAR